MWKIRGEGDSVGAKVTVIARGVPPGWGEPVFDRLDADLAHAMMSINAVKAVEIGAGAPRRPARQRASRRAHADRVSEQQRWRHPRRHFIRSGCRGSGHFKPTSSIQVPGRSIDVAGNPVEVVTTGGTIRVSACAARPSAKRCLRSC
jgi:chorismate synthase